MATIPPPVGGVEVVRSVMAELCREMAPVASIRVVRMGVAWEVVVRRLRVRVRRRRRMVGDFVRDDDGGDGDDDGADDGIGRRDNFTVDAIFISSIRTACWMD